MVKKMQYRRLLLLAMLLGAAFAGLGYRLVDLQVLRDEDLQKEASEETKHTYHLEPRRGDILDIKGNLLATSVFVKTVVVDPRLIGNRQAEVARALAPLLQTNEAWLAQRLLPGLHKNDKGEDVTNSYVVLKRKVSAEAWQKIHDTMAGLSFGLDEKHLPKKERAFYRLLREKAIFADDDQLRTYPNQSLAAHLLGYIPVERNDDGDDVGGDGIERALNSQLSGVRGWRVTERDRQQREMVALREQDVEPRNGLNVVLTIDSVIQHILETALAEGMEKAQPISVSGI